MSRIEYVLPGTWYTSTSKSIEHCFDILDLSEIFSFEERRQRASQARSQITHHRSQITGHRSQQHKYIYVVYCIRRCVVNMGAPDRVVPGKIDFLSWRSGRSTKIVRRRVHLRGWKQAYLRVPFFYEEYYIGCPPKVCGTGRGRLTSQR